jgi:addiction module RelE/StbE family toxin
MWIIFEHKSVMKTISKLPEQVIERYEFWKNIIEIDGIEGLKNIRGFNDEALKGKWFGYRSSRLNIQYRVIYKVDKQRVLVYVERISAHNYRRF